VTSDGFVGVMERIGDKGHRVVQFIQGTIIPGFEGLAAAFSGEGVTSDGFVGAMEQIGVEGKKILDYVRGTLVPDIASAFGTVKTKITGALSGIDLSAVGAGFAKQAQTWGGQIIAGVKVGLDTGDWSGLGRTVGSGIIAAIGGAADLAKRIAGKLGELFGKVDWVGLGITVGKLAVPFFVGLAAGLLNFDMVGLVRGVMAHWSDILLAGIALFLAPARVVGMVAEMLARIPLVGEMLAWGLRALKGFTDTMGRAVLRSIGFIGRNFLEGFARIFPGIGTNFLAHLRNLPTYVGVVALEVRAKAAAMMRGLADSIARGIGGVIAKIGELIARMLRPFVGAAGWLIRRGVEFVAGLVRGVLSMVGSASSAAGRVITTIRGRFNGTAGWLEHAGSQLIQGLLQGAINSLGAVGEWARRIGSRIVSAVKSFFGIHSPSTVFAEIGGHMMAGLAQGMIASNPVALVGKVFGGMTGALRTLFSKNLLGNITNFGGKALSALGGLASSALGAVGGSAPSSVSGNAALVKGMAQLFGWQGAEWDALYKLVMRESGFRNTAQNPTSTAYGMFQFLDSTWGSYGPKTSNPTDQARYGLQYIKQRYGDPLAAWGHEQVYGWYGSGLAPTVFSSPTLIGVGERGPETVTVVPRRTQTSAGAGVTVVINGVVGDKQAVHNAIVQALREFQKRTGRPVTA
jgi:hypothetical protein